MALELYFHPLASFCHKVLIALYENDTPFAPCFLDLADQEQAAKFVDLWPVGKMPVLQDHARDRTIPETSIIIEYLQQHYPGHRPMLPHDPAQQLEARLWDRFFDLYVHIPMQKFVIDRIQPEGERDPRGVADARSTLMTAYGMIDRQLAGKSWATGGDFSIADCAAAPSLFYAGTIVPFPAQHKNLSAYFERLVTRPSFKRVLEEAQPYFHLYPYHENVPARFLSAR